MNFNGLLFVLDFHGGVEALVGLLGLPRDNGVISFDVFIMNFISVDIGMYSLILFWRQSLERPIKDGLFWSQ